MGTSRGSERWNHNIHYHSVVLRAVPSGAKAALDVGTGDGLLAHELREVVPHVVGLDVDAAALERARTEDERVEWVLGDLRTVAFPPGTFDLVASIATLHHLPDLEAALRRLAELTAPGGAVVVIGLARTAGPIDYCYSAIGLVWHRLLTRHRVVWDHSAPTVWPPPHTYSEVRAAARRTLPGVRWKRLALWRYALVWHKSEVQGAEPGR